jgi:hypothetical protein
MLVDGTVTAVTGECAAYADIVPGCVSLSAGTRFDPQNYVAGQKADLLSGNFAS